MAKDTGIVNIHGKEYQTVAYRVGKFREQYGLDMALVTEIIYADDKVVRMKATISNDKGVIATGHYEEYRASSNINKTSAWENAETSAIGRALASLGLNGTEFASADEVARAISGKPAAPAPAAMSPVKKEPLSENQVADFLAAIDSAADETELTKAYKAAYRVAQGQGDQAAIVKFTTTKDAKKAELGIA